MPKKPKWVVEKERAKKADAAETLWLFGLHAVRDALVNPRREKLRLVLTRNAADKLADAVTRSGMTPEISDPRSFAAPLDPGSRFHGFRVVPPNHTSPHASAPSVSLATRTAPASSSFSTTAAS